MKKLKFISGSEGHSLVKGGLFILLMFLSLYTSGQSERKLIRDGNELYKEKKFAEAESAYKKSLGANNKSIPGNYNLGNSLYKQGKFEDAEKQFETIAGDKSLNEDQKAMLYHNMGNSLLKDQKYEESIKAYKNSLKLNPKDNDTRYNLAYAQARLQQQQQQQQQNKDQQNKDQQNKDKKDQQDQKKDQQDQKKDDQQQEMNKKEQNQAQKKKEISKEDAEKILQALNNDEKNTQKKLTKKQPVKVSIEKEW